VKKRRILFAGVFLVACVFVIVAVLFLLRRRPLEVPFEETIKSFKFSSEKSLNEWEEKVLSKNSTLYSVTEYGGKDCVKAESKDSASTLYFRQKLLYARNPVVSWDWKAEDFPDRKKKEELKKKSEFDFVAQVYVIFYARFFLNAKAIQYVWTEDVPKGTVSDSPYTKKVKILVLESGPSDTWKHEKRDIREDYRELFGEELDKDVMAISFMTDSDSTGTEAVAYFSNIELGYLGKEEASPETDADKEESNIPTPRLPRMPALAEEEAADGKKASD
jgi:hypothetical protein